LTLTNALQAVRSQWWLVIAAVLVGLGTAVAVSFNATPVYESTTRLFVGASGTTESADAYAAGLFAEQRVQSYVRVVEGDRVAHRVIDELDLGLTPGELAGKVTVRPVEDTVILEVTASDGSPGGARDIAASVGRHAIEQLTSLETTDGAVDPAIRVTTLDEATAPGEPVSPDVPRNIALGVVLGLLLGLLAVLLPVRFRRTVTSREEIRDSTGAALLATLVDGRGGRADGAATELLADVANREGLRALRSRLLHGHGETPPRIVVVTSAARGEGASSVAVGLALTLAETGARTLLVDADVRRPHIARYLGLPEGVGLTDVLSERATLEDAVRPWGDNPLTVLTAGSVPMTSEAVCDSPALRTLLNPLRSTQDLVIIDAPPLDPVPDAAAVARWADGLILVTRYGRTRREELADAAAVLKRKQADLLGVVLNRVPRAVARSRGFRHPYPADADRGAEPGAAGRRTGAGEAGDDDARHAPGSAVARAAQPELP
jgi:tyrosine-protein kinase